MNQAEITEERYDNAFECLPPIFISHLNGKPIKNCFANSEAYKHNEKGVVLAVYFNVDDKHFETFANIVTNDGRYMQESYNYHYSTLKAETI